MHALPYFDAHNHLQDPLLAAHRGAALAECAAAGIRTMVVNGTCEADWPVVASLAAGSRMVLPSFGLHPWHCGNRSPSWLETLRLHLAGMPAAAVGEIGIDRWILDRAKPDDPRLSGLIRAPIPEQTEVFVQQIALAAELNRPASVHCIDAWGSLLELLRSSRLPSKGFLLHAYAGPRELLASFADLGAYFSFNGSFLSPQRQSAAELWRKIPRDRLLVETDAPSMPPPAPYIVRELPGVGGKAALNHPLNLTAIYSGLAELLGLPLEGLLALTRANFERLFGPCA